MIGFWERIVFAFRCSLSILLRAAIPDDIAQKLLKPAAPVQQAPVAVAPAASRFKEAERPTSDTLDRAVQMLALLQRDGRLIDFLAKISPPIPTRNWEPRSAPSTRRAGKYSTSM